MMTCVCKITLTRRAITKNYYYRGLELVEFSLFNYLKNAIIFYLYLHLGRLTLLSECVNVTSYLVTGISVVAAVNTPSNVRQV